MWLESTERPLLPEKRYHWFRGGLDEAREILGGDGYILREPENACSPDVTTSGDLGFPAHT